MTLKVGQDFKKRWLNAPDAVRHAFLDDLSRISDLLHPDSEIQVWLENDQRAQQLAQLKVEHAYAEEKARLIEEARVRKQLALEKALSEKRAHQQAYDQSLVQDEMRQFQNQTTVLIKLRETLDLEISDYSARYTRNPSNVATQNKPKENQLSDDKIKSELESLRLRLELEAENLIEESVQTFTAKLKIAAEDEISYILKQSNLN